MKKQDPSSEWLSALVTKSTGSWYQVRCPDGRSYACRMEGKLRLRGLKTTNPIAVGDEVWIAPQNDTEALIKDIQPRRNYIIRQSVNLARQYQIIAANLDQALLMATLDFPKTFPRFIDRFLVTAQAYRIPALLVYNKIDLYPPELLEELEYWTYVYRDAGCQVLHLSVNKPLGLTDLQQQLEGRRTLLSGHSGVGKSSLLNALIPGLERPVGSISSSHQQGQHTTTFAELFFLPFGGSLIDTPGIKGFGLADMNNRELGDYFPEILALKEQCKFSNCRHLQEPSCAVKAAVEGGRLALSRYESYRDFSLAPDEQSFRKDPYGE